MSSLGNSTTSQYGGIVPVPGIVSNHRYIDVMTVRPSQIARTTATNFFQSQTPNDHHINRSNTPNASQKFGASESKRNNGSAPAHLHAQVHSLMANQSKQLPAHSSLLIEPILLPNLQHVNVDNLQDLEESCLFYPDGHKNRNIRREIENNVVKHHMLENSRIKTVVKKDHYRITPKDPYADVKGHSLYFTKKKDPEVQQLLKDVRAKEKKILNTTQVRL